MAADADEAITEAEGGAVRYCYVTPKVIITEDRADVADENAQWSSRSAKTWASIRATKP